MFAKSKSVMSQVLLISALGLLTSTVPTWAQESSQNAWPEGAFVKISLSDIHGIDSLAAAEKKSPNNSSANLDSQSVHLYQFVLDDGAKVSLLCTADSADAKKHLRLSPQLAARTQPTSKFAQQSGAIVAVNGGYFNLSDGVSASYVVLDGKVKADPTTNKALTNNPKLKSFLPQIFDRSELRVYKKESDSTWSYDICQHSASVPTGLKLVDSVQGGPRLLPELTAEKEAFVRTEGDGTVVDSIGCGRTAARTAVGLLKNGQIVIVSVAGKKQDEFSAGVSLIRLAELFRKLCVSQALNFDGGTSATMIFWQKMLVGKNPETVVKSALCLISDR